MRISFFVAVTFIDAILLIEASNIQPFKIDDEGNLEYFLVETSPGVYEKENLVNAEIDTRAVKEDLSYHFYTQKNPFVGIPIKSDNTKSLKGTEFSILRKTMFIVHGWTGDRESPLNYHIREAILSKHDINVIVVDWGVIAGRNYISARRSVGKVGQFVADFINNLKDDYSIRPVDITLVGFSLGAHVVGCAGAALDGEIGHIVGLDPAGPLVKESDIDNRLDPTDARFVHVIHTNGGLLGYKKYSGHADYYPNGGGMRQPGCGVDIVGICSHSRAYAYFVESILADNNSFVAYSCESYSKYAAGRCNDNSKSVMGGYTVDERAYGNYYLETYSIAPFAKG